MIRAGDLTLDGHGLDPAQLAALLDRRDAALRAWGTDAGAADATGDAVLTAQIAGELLAFPMRRIAAVIAPPRTARLPGSPPGHAGVFAHGGAVWNLFDPAAALGLAGGEPPIAVLLLRGGVPRVAIGVASAPAIDQLLNEDGDDEEVAALARTQAAGHARLVDVEALGAALLNGRIAAAKEED